MKAIKIKLADPMIFDFIKIKLADPMIFIVFLSLINTTIVQAGLVSVDWKTLGDNLITRDTSTGLEWLDLTETTNISYNDVVLQLGGGGQFEGWSYANPSEVESLFDSAGGTAPYDSSWNTANNGVVVPLLNLWGETSPGLLTSEFIISEVSIFGEWHRTGVITDRPGNQDAPTADLLITIAGHKEDKNAPLRVGSALVRVAVVPIPASIWFFGSGVLGLISFARKNRKDVGPIVTS